MKPEVINEIKAYVKERDEILLKDDLEAFMQWAKNKGINFPSQEIAEITRHKMIMVVQSLPKELKARARKWLLDRNYFPWD